MAESGLAPSVRAYLDAAAAAARLLGDPAVAACWHQPSALAKLDVAGLAGHLARQVLHVRPLLEAPPAEEPPIPLLEHYQRVGWFGADLDDVDNVRIREASLKEAADGPAALAARARDELAKLPALLAAQSPERAVELSWASWALSLEDFLATRLLELVVHCDDLAVSVGVASPAQSAAVLDPVLALLLQLAVHRHGSIPVLRALSRSERAPRSIAAF